MTNRPEDPELAARYRELAQLQKQIMTDQAQQNRLEQQKTAAEAQVSLLTGLLAHEKDALHKAEARLARLHASLSWRITAPLRHLIRLFRRG